MKLKVNVYFDGNNQEEVDSVIKGLDGVFKFAVGEIKNGKKSVLVKIPLGHILVTDEENEILD